MKDYPKEIEADIDAWIAAALVDDLSPEESVAFETHLAAHPKSRALYQETLAMTKALEDKLALDRPDPNFEDRIVKGFRDRTTRSGEGIFSRLSRGFRLPYVYLPAAAAVLIGLVQIGAEITRPSLALKPESVHGSASAVVPLAGRLFRDGGSGNIINQPIFDANGKNEGFVGFINYGSPIGDSSSTTTTATSIDSLKGAKEESFKVFRKVGDSSIVSGLDKSKGVDLMTAPKVTTKSGQTETVQVIREFTSPWGSDAKAQAATPTQPVAPTEPNAAQQQPLGNSEVIDRRKLVRNATLDLEVKNYEAAADAIATVAAGNSGYVATKNSARLPNGKMSGTIVIKVLPDRLDSALLQVRSLGELKNQSLATRDVTKEYFDTDARLRNARKMEERLLALLDTMKGKISELLSVEKELARVREQIEEMQGELKVYDSLVQYATITISLREKDLNEAAAYLLKERVTLSLFSSDVEKTYEAARREVEADQAQVVQSRLVKEDSGRVTAVMSLLIAPDDAESLISRIKGLGRVQNFNKENQRVAQEGSANSETAKVERDKVQLNLTILPDDESRKQVGLTIITKKVEAAFEEAKAAATTQGADIVSSDLQRTTDGGSQAYLTVRVPAGNYAALLETFKKAGLTAQFKIQRDDASGKDSDKVPVLIALTLTDVDQPVQFTQALILSKNVEEQVARIKKSVGQPDSQTEIKTSTFELTSDGRKTANLVFRLPLGKYPDFLRKIEGLGQVKDLSVRRHDRPEATASELATAEVSVRLYSRGHVVAEDIGLAATLRKTLGEGVGALMWSVRMIGVALAFLAPWGIALAGLVWIALRFRNRRK